MSKRLFLIGLFGLIVGSILTAPLTARPSETSGLSEVRITRLAKGINIPGWLWLNRRSVDELQKRYPDTDFQLIKKLGFTNVRVPIDMANVYDKNQPDFLNKTTLKYLDSFKIFGQWDKENPLLRFSHYHRPA
jgi:aryl-phospho-beta-D-glucosidase BglC (GH1 family)